MNENEIAKIVVDICYRIHKALGPGLFESVYEEILFFELVEYGFSVERQKPIPVIWKERKMNLGFRADLIVNQKIIIEVKSVETINPIHPKQVLTYIRLTGIKLGLLVNFNEPIIKSGLKRIVNGL